MIKAVIFDMDGTLLDSEPVWLKTDLAVVAAYGGFMTPEEHDQYIGMGAKDFIPLLREKYNIQASYEEILAFQLKTVLELARTEIVAFPEMVKFARWAKGKGIATAIASGSASEVIEEMCGFAGIRELFEHRVSSHEVEKGKPWPDVFLETAKRLGIEPEHCLVIEDSPLGVEAARRAGMSCAAVPDPVSTDPKGYLESAGILYPRGMLEFTSASLIEKLEDRVLQLA